VNDVSQQTPRRFWGLPLAELLLVAVVVLTIGVGIGAFAMTAPSASPQTPEWWDSIGGLDTDGRARNTLNHSPAF